MFGKYFYNKNIRNIVILFGTLFNDINIRRYEGTGTKQQDFKIPIAYGPAQKYLTKINQGSIDDDSVHVGITLPRMSFEIITMTYDPTRKLQKTKRVETLKKLGNLNNISVRNGGNSYKAEETTVTISDAPSDYGRTATATAVITDGILVSVEVDDGGTDYINAPTVTNDSSTGTGESLEAVIENGIVTSINILSGGSGFVSPVEIFLSPPENFTSPATASNAAILNGILNTIEIVDGGTDYITPPTVTLNSSAGTGENLEVIIDNGTVTAINVLDGGVDFVSPVEVVLSAPQQGIIDSIGIVDGGLGYTTAPTVTVDNNTGTGENLEAVIDANGTVTAINVLSGGVDFVEPVEIILSEPPLGGTRATTKNVFVRDGVITSINITDEGFGYNKEPDVIISSTGAGSSGTAKATLNPVSRDINRLLTTYTPVPYNFEIDLSVMVLNSDDGAQILEQILPYFTPEFHVTLNEESELEIKRDIPIILNNITTEDDYEGDFVSRRSLTHTLSFTVQGYLYGPSKSVGIIREIDINSGDNFKIDDETGRLSSPAANVKVKPKTSTEGPADEPVKITTTITDV